MDARQKHLAARVSSLAPAGIQRGEEHGLLAPARLYRAGDSWHNTVSRSQRSPFRDRQTWTRFRALIVAKRLTGNDRCVCECAEATVLQSQTIQTIGKGIGCREGWGRDTVANISKSNNESGRLDDTITPSMCGNAARIRATLVERLLSGIDRYGNRFSFET